MLTLIALLAGATLAILLYLIVDDTILTPRARRKNQERRDYKSISAAIEQLTRQTTLLMHQVNATAPKNEQ